MDEADKLLWDERDRRITDRFIALEKSTDERFVQSDRATALALENAKEGTNKSEAAQKEYNARSNEFRAALDDQSKLMLTRTEFTVAQKAFEDRLEKFERLTTADIRELRESRSLVQGGKTQSQESRQQNFAALGAGIGIAGVAIALAGVLAAVLSR